MFLCIILIMPLMCIFLCYWRRLLKYLHRLANRGWVWFSYKWSSASKISVVAINVQYSLTCFCNPFGSVTSGLPRPSPLVCALSYAAVLKQWTLHWWRVTGTVPRVTVPLHPFINAERELGQTASIFLQDVGMPDRELSLTSWSLGGAFSTNYTNQPVR